MPKRLSFFSKVPAILVLGFFICPSSAHAGFQWTPPSDNVIVMPQQAAPSATTAPEIISPIIIEGKGSTTSNSGLAPTPMPAIAPAPVQDSMLSRDTHMTMHPLLPPSSTTTTTTVTTTASPALSLGPIVRGFAKQVPLAVALRQILPAGYGFSVDPDVDLGVLISFQGGKPWRETLTDALSPAGLVMHERNQMIGISKMGSPANSAASIAEKSSSPVTTPTSVPSLAPHVLETPEEAMAPAPSISIASSSPTTEVWEAARGDSLHKVIEAWAHRSNIELNWMSEYDYPMQASFTYTGTFEDAVRSLLTGFEEAHPQPIAELHSNPGLGQRVLVVETRGNTSN